MAVMYLKYGKTTEKADQPAHAKPMSIIINCKNFDFSSPQEAEKKCHGKGMSHLINL